ncbi:MULTISPECIES: DUF2442 domain-containing protein [Paraburkholderia]|uniref:Ethanolamine utilization protein EutA (Predicted chaperonin) n=1 Tax=Paraburkholderia fungorum TaxID=134537 RepID=A0AAW3UXR0_9BURK|nr:MULTISPECIES: DUF2442 domain-containing protein [Paraburkholderia]KFX64416.1 ethanolamine utilization protein [Burkholderia sp. K24]MBB4515481.1 ethanolamine utilization protein EutA (predicted chaperonin) [Paraburkholderia fungorum]MBB6203424.1 ethanolamine utilization protein EutA (predicted chaperonin) [Paraburkholderia fungorum]PZR45125.1 MAG: DUF2442 domain-containing protein [Paraburkholderia fungorum]USX07386.1 DUF2442 domain-containing protein [Paraburkholderia fungorum]
MRGLAIDVRFEGRHLLLDLSEGRPVRIPLNWLPVLKAATQEERERFAISMDRQQLFWPEIDEDVNVAALLAFMSNTARR